MLLIAAALVFAVAKAGFGSDSNGNEKAFQGAGSIPATAGARVVMVREDDAFYGLARDRTLIAKRAAQAVQSAPVANLGVPAASLLPITKVRWRGRSPPASAIISGPAKVSCLKCR